MRGFLFAKSVVISQFLRYNINMERKGAKVILTVEEYDRLAETAEQYNEVLKNISDRILQQNLPAYRELAKENWGKK